MFSQEMFRDRIAFDNRWWSIGKINDNYAAPLTIRRSFGRQSRFASGTESANCG